MLRASNLRRTLLSILLDGADRVPVLGKSVLDHGSFVSCSCVLRPFEMPIPLSSRIFEISTNKVLFRSSFRIAVSQEFGLMQPRNTTNYLQWHRTHTTQQSPASTSASCSPFQLRTTHHAAAALCKNITLQHAP